MIAAVITSTWKARSSPRLREDVILVVLEDGTARLLDLAGDIYALTDVAARMLEGTVTAGVESACRSIVAQYHANEDVVRHDLAAFLNDLERRGLLLRGSPSRRWHVKSALVWLTAPLVYSFSSRRVALVIRVWALLTLAYVSTHMFGWAHTVRLWQRLFSGKRQLVERPDDLADAIDRRVREAIARHALPVGCKERALTCWAAARSGGLPARIQLGIHLFPLATHCWCEYEARILADRLDGNCDRYHPLLSYS